MRTRKHILGVLTWSMALTALAGAQDFAGKTVTIYVGYRPRRRL